MERFHAADRPVPGLIPEPRDSDIARTAVRRRVRSVPLPLRGWPLAALVAAFLLPGLIGHDPWKTEDAIGFGVVYQMLVSGDWLTPRLAGEPFYEDGPLYFWVAGALAVLLGSLLPAHDATRFASAFFVLVALYCVRLAGRALYGRTQGDLSMLALLGSVGLLWHAHETVAETAMLAGLAAAYYGVALSRKKPYKAALFFGTGSGVAFLAKGLVAVIQPAAAALLVLALSARFRQRNFALSVGFGLIILTPFLFAWPALVAHRAPEYFEGWIGWQLGQLSNVPRMTELAGLVKTLLWAAWPIWPLTLWALWEYRRNLREPGFAVPFVATLVALVLLLFMRRPREMEMLALLVPLAIPAGAAAMASRRGAANALTWFAIMTATVAAGFMWLMWLATLTGLPAPLGRAATRLAPGFHFEVGWLAVAFAAALTAAWFVLISRAERSIVRGLTFWAAGMTLLWGLATTLWLDWIDYKKSYRSVAASLRQVLPANVRCVESRGLGESQRAAFHYHAGLVTLRTEAHGAINCPYLLVQSRLGHAEIDPGPGWTQVWEGARPRDREFHRLYQRTALA
jgi:4-amino-4-deoxy-L-arabinose transferase-like glycosyltransferase